ncbi:uncharacterized protein STEHIDRAFT_130912 [Stereum hirsutum FP-91666 SS1]|uniref:uncharacterized protein n=1 Tax=Stereum hirsutum (strain FP-91666) TaxID=721885 RepID=UPI00044102DC|nr:uncharacterized protein STEHIDRAFT_130912 [Stereum hirsutum FP-91666 SS1]EIM87576.1 hypothetical protein STEHIDRAFT_130912 [Stereum hirsutum FP-91666 SS1]
MPAPTPTPPTTPSVGYPPSSQFDSFDEWMRNTSASALSDPIMFYQGQQQQQQPTPDLSSYPAYVSSLDNSLPPSGSFNPYAMNVFDEDPTLSAQQQQPNNNNEVRAMSIGAGSSSDGGMSMDGLGISPATRRSVSFSGASPSPREWMPLHPPPTSDNMVMDEGGQHAYQRPFFANQKAASTTSLLLPSDVFSPTTSSAFGIGRASSSRSTTDIQSSAPASASTSAIREEFSAELSEEMEALMAFAAGKFSFNGEGGGYGDGDGGFVPGASGFGGEEGRGQGRGQDRNRDQGMEVANQYGFDRTL